MPFAELGARYIIDTGAAAQAINACGLEEGELVALSLEGRHPQAARAWVHGVRAGSITLALDRPLRPGLVQQGQVCFVFGTLPTSLWNGAGRKSDTLRGTVRLACRQHVIHRLSAPSRTCLKMLLGQENSYITWSCTHEMLLFNNRSQANREASGLANNPLKAESH